MKIIKIIASYFSILSIILIIFPILFAKDLPSIEAGILAYDVELWKFRLSMKDGRTILVGPCYVSQLGSFNEFRNLGFPSANLSEIERIIEFYCAENDKVYFGVGAFHFISSRFQLRTIPFSVFERRKMLLKTIVSKQPKKVATRREYIEQLASVANSVSDTDVVHSVQALQRLYKKHPNIEFILFPTYPLDRIAPKMELFHSTLSTCGLPIVDLSNVLDESDFEDLYNATPAGIEKLKKRLAAVD